MSLVSVIFPCYNVAKYVSVALESLLTQTYTDLEIICIDDCSTDDTKLILMDFARKDSRIRLIENPVNLGIAKSLNLGISIANGEFISRTDSDDISMPFRIERQLEYLKNNPNIDLVCHNVDLIDDSGKLIGRSSQHLEDKNIKRAMRWRSSVFHFWLARKKFYDITGEYRFDGVEDYDILLRGISKGFVYANLDESLYSYRVRQGSSAFSNGLMRIKMKNYVYELHKVREANGKLPLPTKPHVTNKNEVRFNRALKIMVKTRSLSSSSVVLVAANILPLLLCPEVFLKESYYTIRYRLVR